ncbi:MAG: hypothetical protein M0Q38_10850 [Bacteroidales bacterium]|jgi:SecD/SecF fusion protein|nr:hypothetical protein [Bacteroidales bacterium]
MKTLKYIITGIMLIIFIPFCYSQATVKNEQIITLQSAAKNVPEKLLSESREILLRRLASLNLRNIQIIQNDTRSELVITVRDNIDHELLSDILLIQGHLNFYETINRQEVLEHIRRQSPDCVQDAFTSLHLRDSIRSIPESVLGIAEGKDTISIDRCLTSDEVNTLFPKELRLLWAIHPDDNKHYSLYCISSSDKTFNEQNIMEAHADFKDAEQPVLCITFKEKVWKLWEEATIRNMNKIIALSIDNKVYSAPRILGEIPHGKISLTGHGFTMNEVRKLVAIISNGTLPLKFIVVGNN